jgi:hypothetical protein
MWRRKQMFSYLSSPLRSVRPPFNFSKRFATIYETWDMHDKYGRNQNTVDLISNSMKFGITVWWTSKVLRLEGRKQHFLKPWNDVRKEALQKYANIFVEIFFSMYNNKSAAMWKYSIACGFISITNEATAERHVKFGMEIDCIHYSST